MLEQFVIGLIVGAVGCLFYLAKKKSSSKTKDGNPMAGTIIYLNVLILDKTSAVQTAVQEKYVFSHNFIFSSKFSTRAVVKIAVVCFRNVFKAA